MKERPVDSERAVVADDQAPEVSQPSDGAFHHPTPPVSPQRATIPRRRTNAILLMRADQFDSPLPRFSPLPYLAVNAVFFDALQAPTSKGRQLIAQLADYKKFLVEVDADAISRGNPSAHPPAHLQTKEAYALAFHLDLG